MINLKQDGIYRMVGIQARDKSLIEEGSTISITRVYERYEYQVLTGKVNSGDPGQKDIFSKGSRLHAYCVPVGLGRANLPDLKEGDYIVSNHLGSKPWRCTRENIDWLAQNGGMTGMRYASDDEVHDLRNQHMDKEAESKFKKDDIVVFNHTNNNRQVICKVSKTEKDKVFSLDSYIAALGLHESNYRPATNLEIIAYKNGYFELKDYQGRIERECMSRFPSPASYVDVYGRTYRSVVYDVPRWIGDSLVLDDHMGIIFCHDQWATPSESRGVLVEDRGAIVGTRIAGSSSKGYVDAQAYKVTHDKPVIVGRGFSEEEYFQNPINQKMDVSSPRRRKTKSHDRIFRSSYL